VPGKEVNMTKKQPKERHVRIRGVQRETVDVRKLGKALIALALAQAEADAEAEDRNKKIEESEGNS
jgi:hypothetical protein